jgi:hypothetical protein
MREAGKGCKPRPRFVADEVYDKNWEQTFRKKDKEKETQDKDKQEDR